MNVEHDEFQDPQVRALGIGQEDTSGYITGNNDDSPDSPDSLQTDRRVPAEIPIQDQVAGGLEPPGAEDFQLGLGGATGTERFDQDPRGGGLGSPEEIRELGDADMRTQETVYHQYSEHHEDQPHDE